MDIVFYFAAQTSSHFANNNPLQDLNINVIPVVHMIETCKNNNYSPDIVFSGTVTEVGMTRKYPVSEESADHPITIYDINKLTAEHYLRY